MIDNSLGRFKGNGEDTWHVAKNNGNIQGVAKVPTGRDEMDGWKKQPTRNSSGIPTHKDWASWWMESPWVPETGACSQDVDQPEKPTKTHKKMVIHWPTKTIGVGATVQLLAGDIAVDVSVEVETPKLYCCHAISAVAISGLIARNLQKKRPTKPI